MGRWVDERIDKAGQRYTGVRGSLSLFTNKQVSNIGDVIEISVVRVSIVKEGVDVYVFVSVSYGVVVGVCVRTLVDPSWRCIVFRKPMTKGKCFLVSSVNQDCTGSHLSPGRCV